MGITAILLGLAGGLGLFLYGMELMSDGLQRVAGSKMRSVLEFFTKNTVLGVLVGTLFTAIIQSSSAATVMVVSFVNAGLMNLYQAFGIILGANIGTTVTAQIVSLDMGEIAPVFVLVGVIMYMFIKRPTVKRIGQVVIGFGVLFLGMNMMSGSMATVRDSAEVVSVMGSLSNPALAILVGVICTSIMQSSSVTVAIVLMLAEQGLLGLEICFYAVLGCNIGACTSALLAAINGSKDAKRAALIHLLFNVIGTILNVIVLVVAMDPVRDFILSVSGGKMGRAVANSQTLFRLAQVIVLLPFSKVIVGLTRVFVRGEDPKPEPQELRYIGKSYVMNSATAVPQVICELNRMGEIATENLDRALQSLLEGDEAKAKQVFEMEHTIDYLNHEITQFLVRANQMSLPIADKNILAALFHVVNDIERIGDHAENVAEDTITQKELNIHFSEAGVSEIREMVALVDEILKLSFDMFRTGKLDNMKRVLELENTIDEKERELQDRHILRLNNNECTAQAGAMFTDLIGNLERVSDHATNIAFAMLEHDPEGDKQPKVRMNPAHE